MLSSFCAKPRRANGNDTQPNATKVPIAISLPYYSLQLPPPATTRSEAQIAHEAAQQPPVVVPSGAAAVAVNPDAPVPRVVQPTVANAANAPNPPAPTANGRPTVSR